MAMSAAEAAEANRREGMISGYYTKMAEGRPQSQPVIQGPIVRMEEKVRPLQDLLGIPPKADGKTSGMMDRETRLAIQEKIEAFQRSQGKEGAEVTGKFDKGTADAMRNSKDEATRKLAEALDPVKRFYKPEAPAQTGGMTAPAAKDAADSDRALLVERETKRSIERIEGALGKKADGKWDAETNYALQMKITEAQAKAGRPQTGVYDADTAAIMRKNPETARIAENLDRMKKDGVLDQLYKPEKLNMIDGPRVKEVGGLTGGMPQGGFMNVPYKSTDPSPVILKGPAEIGNGGGRLMNASDVVARGNITADFSLKSSYDQAIGNASGIALDTMPKQGQAFAAPVQKQQFTVA